MIQNKINNLAIFQKLIQICNNAGQEILKIYNSDNFEFELKKDNSPLTKADKISHEIIEQGLIELTPSIPILSEEGKEIAFTERKNWKSFWLVDPLDGTKEFIKRNGEFTVNIALIENNLPVLGIIHIPVIVETYFGMLETGSFKIDKFGNKSEIKVSSKSLEDELNVVQSRSHSGDEENEFYSHFKIKERISKGSSLKICLVAEGKAELYFRGGPTWEWDTAAGHAILISAGGYFMNKDKSNLIYNKKDPRNYGFIASSIKL
ncbi:MAG: 3'(2'),5'-bisphosphate nucleotidase CysQ [Melioribacteraceae bacterium]